MKKIFAVHLLAALVVVAMPSAHSTLVSSHVFSNHKGMRECVRTYAYERVPVDKSMPGTLSMGACWTKPVHACF